MFRHEEYYQVDDSGLSEFSDLMGKVLEYLAIPVTTGLRTGVCLSLVIYWDPLGTYWLGIYSLLMVTAKLDMLLYQNSLDTGMSQVVIFNR